MPIRKEWLRSGAYADPLAMIQMLGTCFAADRAGPLDNLVRTAPKSRFYWMPVQLLIIFLRQNGSQDHPEQLPQLGLGLFWIGSWY